MDHFQNATSQLEDYISFVIQQKHDLLIDWLIDWLIDYLLDYILDECILQYHVTCNGIISGML